MTHELLLRTIPEHANAVWGQTEHEFVDMLLAIVDQGEYAQRTGLSIADFHASFPEMAHFVILRAVDDLKRGVAQRRQSQNPIPGGGANAQ